MNNERGIPKCPYSFTKIIRSGKEGYKKALTVGCVRATCENIERCVFR